MPNTTTRRYYVNFAPQQGLASGITSSDLSLTVSDSLAGWPASFPFYAVINNGQSDQEIVRVDGIAGSTATLGERGSDNSSAQAHTAGATFDAAFIRKDFDEANAHSSATAGVHGVTGDVVGTTDAQELTNKTLTAPEVDDPVITKGGNAITLPSATTTLVGKDTTDSLTNKTLDDASSIGGVTGAEIAALPKGRVGSGTKATFGNVTTTGGFLGGIADISFTAVAGRRYKVTVTLIDFINTDTQNTARAFFAVYDGGASAPTTGSTLLHEVHAEGPPSTGSGTLVAWSFEVTGLASGTHRLGVYAKAASANGEGTVGGILPGQTCHLIIEDIGT